MEKWETIRLRVRRFREADAPALAEILADTEVMRYLEPPYTQEQTRSFLWEHGLCEPPRIYAVEEKASGMLIGHLIYHPCDGGYWELGWVLRRDRWGQGYAAELTEAAIADAQAHRRVLMLECDPGQGATRRLAERFGFCFRGVEDGLAVYERREGI